MIVVHVCGVGGGEEMDEGIEDQGREES